MGRLIQSALVVVTLVVASVSLAASPAAGVMQRPHAGIGVEHT